MRLSPYQTCPGLDLAWAGPLCLSALARRYVVEPESVKQAAAAMGLPEVRACHALLGQRHYRAAMDRALIADLDFQCRLRVLDDAESELLAGAVQREKKREIKRDWFRRRWSDPAEREVVKAYSRGWKERNRDRHLEGQREWRKANAARISARSRKLWAERKAARLQEAAR